MRSGWVRVLPLALVCACACGSGSAAEQDAAAMPDAVGSVCPVPLGSTYVLTRQTLLPFGQGFDLDGDGAIDNTFGALPAEQRDEISSGLNASIVAGEMILLAHITDWEEGTPTDSDLGFHLFMGTDTDQPENASDNFTGEEEFLAALDQFDLECNSRTLADAASMTDRVLVARRSTWDFPLTTGTGSVILVDPVTEVVLDEDYQSLTGTIGMVMPVCSLSAIPFPGSLSGSTLDALANDAVLQSFVHIDMDVDGDGIEQVIGDGVTVRECIDGDGSVIDGRDCPCHPAIADGISFGIGVAAIKAYIIGVGP